MFFLISWMVLQVTRTQFPKCTKRYSMYINFPNHFGIEFWHVLCTCRCLYVYIFVYRHTKKWPACHVRCLLSLNSGCGSTPKPSPTWQISGTLVIHTQPCCDCGARVFRSCTELHAFQKKIHILYYKFMGDYSTWNIKGIRNKTNILNLSYFIFILFILNIFFLFYC